MSDIFAKLKKKGVKKIVKKRFTIILILFFVVVMFSACEKQNLSFNEFLTVNKIFEQKEALPLTKVNKIVSDYFLDTAPTTKKRKAIILGVDGMRSDALTLLDPKIGIKRIAKDGGIYRMYNNGDDNFTQVTKTAPSWTSMLTGEWGNVTNVTSNSSRKYPDIATFLRTLAVAGKHTSFVAVWDSFFTVVMNGESHNNLTQVNTDDDLTAKKQVINRINNDDDCIFLVLDDVDGAGHKFGYLPSSKPYADCIIERNLWIDEIYQTILDRPTFQNEDWLIIATTDHGGNGFDHGGQSPEETTTFFACNKKII